MTAFDQDTFVADCLAALAEGDRAPAAVRGVLDRTVADAERLTSAIGDPVHLPSMTTWYRSDELTVLHLVWPPAADLAPHDHGMWAAIGLYGGREDNHFYRRDDSGRILPAGGRTMLPTDVAGLGPDVVHRVVNPTKEWTGAIHVYGGDYFAASRTSWSQNDFTPRPFDAEKVSKYLETAAAAARVMT